MTSLEPLTQTQTHRRIVLIDFDWQDADLIPELLRQPDLSVRLVAGERNDDAGLRVAELCGLPRTVDLADLTREIFDLAVVGERSARRTQIEGLLLALGTPCASPQSLATGETPDEDTTPAIEAPLALHAAAFETAIGGESFDQIVEQSLPDLAASGPTAPVEVHPSGQNGTRVTTLEDFPSPEDRQGLEDALAALVASTGARAAELYSGRTDEMDMVVQVGPADPLLKGLIDLALQLNTPQVVSRISGPQEGKAWGAWPFQTTQRRGVLAAAAIDPAEGWTKWERMVDELRNTWDERDRAEVAPGFPIVPNAQTGWLGPEAFHGRVRLAIERNRHDGLRFTVHRLCFPAAPAAVALLAEQLPAQLRETDCICRPTAIEILLLTAAAGDSFVHLRRRLMTMWESCWKQTERRAPAPPLMSEQIEIGVPEEADAFLDTVSRWLAAAH